MTARRPFAVHELGADRRDGLEDAASAAAWLEASMLDVPISVSAGFGDRVMAALAGEPAPSTVGFLAPVRRRGLLAGFAASVRQAWKSLGGRGRPALARASALAYVLAVVVAGAALGGAATVGVAGALGIIGPAETRTPAPQTPGPTLAPEPSTPPTSEATPPVVVPSPEPTESPEESDDNGGGSGSEPSNTPGPAGSDDDHESDAPDASGTPEPTETPHGDGVED